MWYFQLFIVFIICQSVFVTAASVLLLCYSVTYNIRNHEKAVAVWVMVLIGFDSDIFLLGVASVL